MRRTQWAIVAIVAVVVSLTGLDGRSAYALSTAKKSYSVVIDQPLYTESAAPMYVAIKKGFFSKRGVTVKFSTVSQDATVDEAMTAGSIQFGTGGVYSLITADEHGEGYQMVENLGGPTLQLCLRKSFASQRGITPQTPLREMLTRLKGASFGVNGFGSPIIVPLYYLIKSELGVDPANWLKLVNLGTIPAAQAAFERGSIDTLVDSPPVCNETSNGEVMFTTGFLPQFKGSVYSTFYGDAKWMAQHPAETRAVVRAMAEGNSYVVHHPAESARIIQKSYFPSVSVAELTKLMEQYYTKIVPAKGRMSKHGWEVANKTLLGSGLISKVPSADEGVMWTNKYLPS